MTISHQLCLRAQTLNVSAHRSVAPHYADRYGPNGREAFMTPAVRPYSDLSLPKIATFLPTDGETPMTEWRLKYRGKK